MSAQHKNDDDPILLRSDNNHICTLTLNRASRYNALSEELLSALQQALQDIAKDTTIYVVVLTGAGKAFCPGHDLKQMRANHDEIYYRKLFEQCSEVMQGIVNLPQPVIAKVQGMATAAGCQLVASCDMAIAADDVRFAVSGINIGLFCATPSVALSRNISRKHAMEMLLTGEFIDAGTAEKFGLINHAVPREDLDETTERFASIIAAKPAVSIQLGKKLFYSQIEKQLSSAYVEAGDVMACNLLEEDTIEGVDAFLEKRRPSWIKGG